MFVQRATAHCVAPGRYLPQITMCTWVCRHPGAREDGLRWDMKGCGYFATMCIGGTPAPGTGQRLRAPVGTPGIGVTPST